MKLRVRSAAHLDIMVLAEFYEQERSGLGHDFLREVDAIFSLFRRQPYLGQRIDGHPELRGFQLKRFPYRVIYHLANNEVTILAVAHQRRRPESWQDRVQEAPAIYQLAA